MNTRGSYIVTFTGRAFYPLDARPEDVNIFDIAHALSRVCRYGGHTREHYSVAEHSVRCSLIVAPSNALCALLHDATEAYIGDMVRPLKVNMPQYREVEDHVWRAVASKFGLPEAMPAEVKKADQILLRTEQRDLMPPCPFDGQLYGDEETARLVEVIQPWTANFARAQFMHRFEELKNTTLLLARNGV